MWLCSRLSFQICVHFIVQTIAKKRESPKRRKNKREKKVHRTTLKEYNFPKGTWNDQNSKRTSVKVHDCTKQEIKLPASVFPSIVLKSPAGISLFRRKVRERKKKKPTKIFELWASKEKNFLFGKTQVFFDVKPYIFAL